MTSHSTVRTGEFISNYRATLQYLDKNKYNRVVPRMAAKAKVYKPTSTVSTTEASPLFIPLFYAGEKGALGIWDKATGTGYIKRRLDEEDRSYHVLDVSNPRNSLATYISAPRSALEALHITLPHLIIVSKNFCRNFGFDVLVMDSNAYRRRFSFATWYHPATLKKYSFMCQVPLKLEIGWNEIHVNFNELVNSTYKTNYVETIRIQIYASCHLRQIFFCDDRMLKGEVPVPSMKDFENIRTIPLDYGPRTHPNAIEAGPEKARNLPYIEPPAQTAASRLEQDLKQFQRKRFNEVSKQRLALQPYKTYFRELLHEEKQKRRYSNAMEAQMIEELEGKFVKGDDENGETCTDTENNNGDSPATFMPASVTKTVPVVLPPFNPPLSTQTIYKTLFPPNLDESKIIETPKFTLKPTITEKPKTAAAEKPKTAAAAEKPKTAAAEKPKTVVAVAEKPKTVVAVAEKPKTVVTVAEKPKTAAEKSKTVAEKPKTAAEKPVNIGPPTNAKRVFPQNSSKPGGRISVSRKYI